MGTSSRFRPRIALLHYTAPPIIGGVERVIAEHARLFAQAGYPVTMIAGRGGMDALPPQVEMASIPEIDSKYAPYLAMEDTLKAGGMPSKFPALQSRIEEALSRVLASMDVLIAHNVMTTHFNLALTAAVHNLMDRRVIRRTIVWCHDISRHVNPASGAAQFLGFPWDLLRRRRPDFTYAAVSIQRQRLLANVLKCPPGEIQVVSNGVDSAQLLGLSELGEHLVKEFGLSSADLIILMPVRITRAKHIEFALHVAAALKRSGVCLRLVVTGPPDPHVPEIRACFAELKELRTSLSLAEEAIFAYDGTGKYPAPFILDATAVAQLL